MKQSKKVDLGILVFMAVVVVLVVLIASDEHYRRAADTGENRPYPYVSDPAIVAQASVQAPYFRGYVVWNANTGTWQSQDAQDHVGRYCEYSRQPDETAILERHTGV